MDDVELPLLGTEPLVVEFANTRYGDRDLLGTAELAGLWFTAAGAPPARDTAAARALRDSVHTLFTATVTGATPSATAITHVNEVAAGAPTSPRLVRLSTGALGAGGRRGGATGDAALLGGLATACVELLTGDQAGSLCRCAGPDCGLFFVRHHPRRRYCHESCGHRDRQQRYYRRRAADRH
ncbi:MULTISPECIES: CGNR zinc finger domain-containing protein [Catenuloplanes]|uniref:RNA-binding Zn ribbon-like protein n=1 Tax=Catenuloplanes niger TaxID=587534 RepID=A0AAE3ZMC0_9ACTN|nr:ABATE domain-containing protein [Catenuloplanes niger]MDR7322417.1 putative RNA-binding Zn ribbon-like protein [Catenuloplanes niger]